MSKFISRDYSEARAKFLETCRSKGAEVRPYRYGNLSEEVSQELVIDTARFGPPDASPTLVLISGTHGIEGFCGSACQIATVVNGTCNGLPPNTSVLLIHALNPYGFATLRRVDSENIDINRNFVHDFDAMATYNSEYDSLNAALNPVRWQEDGPQDGDDVIAEFIKTKGIKKFQEVVSIGQYRHPEGLFFGGKRKSRSRIILEGIIHTELRNAYSVAVIDFHTGLGLKGIGEIISFESEDSATYEQSVNWFGPNVKSTKAATTTVASVSADVGGSVDNAFKTKTRAVTFVSLEFGTVPVPDVLRALRAENWLTHYGRSDSALARKIKEDLRSAFCPTDQLWENMILDRSREVVEQALVGLATSEQ